MNKRKEEMLNYLKQVADLSITDLKERAGYENYEIIDVQYCGEVERTNRKTGEKITLPRVKVIAADKDNTELITKSTYIGLEELNSELLKEYEIAESIRDEVGEEAKEDERYSLRELEEEKSKEQEEITKEDDEKKKENKEENQNKKRKPSHVIEKVNPDKAKMDYWQTVKQACGLPEKVDTLAFSYPVSTEDKVDYANITVYMLDKDGYIIDDLDVDDYFEFDSSTGNNPMQDNVVRHEEEDSNAGKAQIEDNRTMIRLYAKNSDDKNTFISLEQKNSFGDYNDINAGRKTVAGTQNVEKQLETDRVRVWDSEEEKLMKSNAGMFNMNEIFEEAEAHKEHGDEEYIDAENADGDNETIEVCNSDIIPGTDKTWEELSEETGEGIKKLQERFEREFEKGKKPEDILEEIEYDYEMTGREHKHN